MCLQEKEIMCLQEKQEKAYLPHREDKPFLFMQIL